MIIHNKVNKVCEDKIALQSPWLVIMKSVHRSYIFNLLEPKASFCRRKQKVILYET